MQAVAQVLREIWAGALVACLALPVCVGAGVLAYGPFGADRVAFAAIAGLIGAVVCGTVAALARRSSFVVTVPTTPVALIQASFAATLLDVFHGDMALTLAAMPLCALTVGLLQLLFGLSGLARLVKFAPYPVIAGFTTGIGLLMALAQFPKLFGLRSGSELLHALMALSVERPLMPAFGMLLVGVIFVLSWAAPKFPALLGGLVAGLIGYHGLQFVAPGADLGPTLGAISLSTFIEGARFDPGILASLADNFAALQTLLLSAATIALLGTLDIFFALRLAQNLADLPVSPRRDLIGQGIANLAGSLAGGLAVSTSLGLSAASYRAGGRSRLSSISAAIALLVAVVFLPQLIYRLPVVVLAAILFAVGLLLADRWVMVIAHEALRSGERAHRSRARRNILIVLAVVLATVLGQPVVGAAVGVLLAGIMFIMDMSQPVVRRRLRGDRLRSKRVRSVHDLDFLTAKGGGVVVLELQGVLFFGNADDLATELRNYDDDADIIILDMHRISSVDTSGAAVLQQIAARCRARGKSLLVCANHPGFTRIVEMAVTGSETSVSPSLDSALEWAENRIIARAETHAAAVELPLERTDLARDLAAPDLAILSDYLTPTHYASGEALCRAGDAADRFWIIRRGSVSVRLPESKSQLRLASLGPGCTVGEMGLLESARRSADVIADETVEAYLLTRESFDAIMREHPHVGQAVLSNIARQLAQRLRHTSEDLRLAEA